MTSPTMATGLLRANCRRAIEVEVVVVVVLQHVSGIPK